MFSITKNRTAALATMGTALIMAILTLITAAPAEAMPRLVCVVNGGTMECRQAKGCVVKVTHPDGTTTQYYFADGETENISGKNMKCDDGQWVARISSGALPPAGPLVVKAPAGGTVPGAIAKPVGPALLVR